MTDQPDNPGDLQPKDGPKLPHARRSDRVPIELDIQVSGTDCQGRSFMEDTQTAIVSRHGAKIRLGCKMVPEQELTVRCVKTGKESDIRVVGQIGGGPGRYFYGIQLLNQEVNLWGIDFPPMTESEKAVARALMDCGRCHTQELVCMNGFEAEVFEANGSLSRRCKRCTDTTLWKQYVARAPGGPAPEPATAKASPAPAAAPGRTENERKDLRIGLRMRACIRTKECGEEVVTTENVSRGGLSFKSANRYVVGTHVEVAIPYTSGATNIFAPAQIIHVEYLPTDGRFLCGVGNVHQLLFD
jgi:hypothetical protein